MLLGAGNAAGGYAVTDRMLAMFKTSGRQAKHHGPRQGPSPQEEGVNAMLTLISQPPSARPIWCAAFLFMFGLKRMSSPATARVRHPRRGHRAWSPRFSASFLYMFTVDAAAKPHLMVNIGLAVAALPIGGVGAWFVGRKVAMTAMPQMVAIYNGMGGGAAGSIAAVELFGGRAQGDTQLVVTLLGALIGAVSLSGSVIAWAKLQGVLTSRCGSRPAVRTAGHACDARGRWLDRLRYADGVTPVLPVANWIWIFFGVALVFGILMTLPIGGADMPVVISIYNAFTGLAVGLEGFVLQNPALMIAGMVVGAAGLLLTLLMAKAMNRSVANVLFTNFGTPPPRRSPARSRDRTPDRGIRRRHQDALRQQRHHRAGLRPCRRAGRSRSSTSSSSCCWRPRSRSSSRSIPWPAACPARWTCCWPRPACPTT